jgi:hypothetical protein
VGETSRTYSSDGSPALLPLILPAATLLPQSMYTLRVRAAYAAAGDGSGADPPPCQPYVLVAPAAVG